MFKVTLESLDQFIEQDLIPYIEKRKAHIIALEGPLGAGKTTLTKKILKYLGVVEVVNSPTFGYVNSYIAQAGKKINHFDLYRLHSLENFYQEALDELLLDEQAYNFIEWPGVIESLLQEKGNEGICTVSLTLSYDLDDAQSRFIVCR